MKCREKEVCYEINKQKKSKKKPQNSLRTHMYLSTLTEHTFPGFFTFLSLSWQGEIAVRCQNTQGSTCGVISLKSGGKVVVPYHRTVGYKHGADAQ